MTTAGQKDALIVFLPGMFCGAWFWRYYARIGKFEGGFYAELPGLYGIKRPALTFRQEVAAYACVVGDAAGGRRVVLVAHSYGAQHAMALTQRDDVHVEKLVLVAPALGRWWMVGAFGRVICSILRGQGFKGVFLAVEDAEILKNLPMPLDNEKTVGVELHRAAAQAMVVGLQLGRSMALQADVPTLVILPEHDRVLRFPEIDGAVKIRGGHFLFLGSKEFWTVVKVFVDK